MAYAIKSIFYDNHYSIINNVSDLSLMVKLLVEDVVFDYQLSKGSNKLEFINLYIHGSKSISTKGLLELYWYKACKNSKLRLLLDDKLLATKIKIGNESNINIIKRENLFYNDEIKEDNNNIK